MQYLWYPGEENDQNFLRAILLLYVCMHVYIHMYVFMGILSKQIEILDVLFIVWLKLLFLL